MPLVMDLLELNIQSSVMASSMRVGYLKPELNTVSVVDGKTTLIQHTGSKFLSSIGLSVGARLIKHIKPSIRSTSSFRGKQKKYKTVNGQLKTRSTLGTYTYDRKLRESMQVYLPYYYQEFRDFNALIISEANEFTRLYALIDELFDQSFVDKATYSLDDWERATNVNVRSGSTLEDRRNAIKRRINGIGTVTLSKLNDLVNEFYESEAIELTKPGTIEFKIRGIRGEPDDIGEIRRSVNEFIPRHLDAWFSFSFLTWVK